MILPNDLSETLVEGQCGRKTIKKKIKNIPNKYSDISPE